MLGLSDKVNAARPGQPASFNQYTAAGTLEATFLYGRKIS